MSDPNLTDAELRADMTNDAGLVVDCPECCEPQDIVFSFESLVGGRYHRLACGHLVRA